MNQTTIQIQNTINIDEESIRNLAGRRERVVSIRNLVAKDEGDHIRQAQIQKVKMTADQLNLHPLAKKDA